MIPRNDHFKGEAAMFHSFQSLHYPLPSACISLRPALLLSLLLATPLAQAQPDLRTTQLLFEPRPVPQESETTDGTFASIDALPQLSENPAPRENNISSERRQEIDAAIAAYLTSIGNREAEAGPYNDQLSEDLLSTGLLHQELGDHAEALNFFIRAQNISRLNYGIDTLDQVPSMEAMVASHMALLQLVQADEVQEGLLYLLQQAHGADSPEAASALHAMGDWNLRAFLERSNIAINIPRMNVTEFVFGSGISSASNGMVQSPEDLQNQLITPLYKLYLAQGNFLNAINVLVQREDYTNPELLDLERKLLTTMFLRTHQENIVYEPDFYLNRKTQATGTRLDTSGINLRNSEDFSVGQASLERRMAYLTRNAARTPAQVAGTMLEQADWDLLFERTRTAEDKYAAAYQFFEDNPQMTATIRDLVYPEMPVVLPTFLPAPNSRERLGIAPDAEVDYFGYFDVSFALTKNGKTRRVKVLERGGRVTRNMEIRLNDYLKNLVFRPRYTAGKLDTGTLTLRYYVGY